MHRDVRKVYSHADHERNVTRITDALDDPHQPNTPTREQSNQNRAQQTLGIDKGHLETPKSFENIP
jgi:hypothetical protein